MEVTGVSSGGQPSGASTIPVSPVDQALMGLGKDAFLKMLIAQIRYQNPLDPVKNDDFVAQLAQFSSLEAMQNVRTAVEGQAQTESLTSAASMIGREIEILGPDATPLFGVVEQVEQTDGKVYMRVGETLVSMDQVVSVR